MGLITVGPQSAGAVPGPICYGRGGTRPTLTDANLILGYLNAGLFQRRCDDARPCRRCVGIDAAIAKPLACRSSRPPGASTQSRTAIWSARCGWFRSSADATCAYALIAFGGAGPPHACRLARAIGIPKVVAVRRRRRFRCRAPGFSIRSMRARPASSRLMATQKRDCDHPARAEQAARAEVAQLDLGDASDPAQRVHALCGQGYDCSRRCRMA
jgi:N-methylhydantoinase A/oxoprolinase/acetone carboxylase beta subunit